MPFFLVLFSNGGQTKLDVAYVRYVDDMIFAMKRRGNSDAVYYRVKQVLKKTLENLKQVENSIELIRGRPQPEWEEEGQSNNGPLCTFVEADPLYREFLKREQLTEGGWQ